jgi:hypothetical protein
MPRYEIWRSDEESSLVCATDLSITDMRARGVMASDAQFVCAFDAATMEEAMAIRNLRMGWEPFRPQGAPGRCSNCGSWYYPEGSGECWQCGRQVS